MEANCGFKFYSDIYNIANGQIISDPRRITSFLNQQFYDYGPYGVASENQEFQLVVAEPGLILGVGLPHGVHDDTNDFKIGFYFDHTYGMPIIPGSSVKGKLRSVFPQYGRDHTTADAIKDVKARWLIKLISCINDDDDDFFLDPYNPIDEINDIQKDFITALELEIFEGIRNHKNISIYNRDIFHDALISGPLDEKMFGSDYITPHKHKTNSELDPFTDPTPIRFLRLMPGLVFDFQFDLKNSELVYNGFTLKVENKLKLFKKILLTTGIGAKTNVGYGQFYNVE